MIENGNMDIKELKKKNSYPWNLLNKTGDYFIWEDQDDAQKIRASGQFQKFKITCRKQNDKLLVVRL